MLSFEGYSQQTHRTAAYPEDQAELYLALGIADEAGELKAAVTDSITPDIREKITAEMGDVYWYISELSRQLEFDVRGEDGTYKSGMYYSEGSERVDKALEYACQVAGQAKKALRDDDGEFTDQRVANIKALVAGVRSGLRDAAHHLGLGGEEVVLTRNAEKLSIRKEEGLIQGEGEGDERVSTA